jgi:DNA-binding response OmpR family regulator
MIVPLTKSSEVFRGLPTVTARTVLIADDDPTLVTALALRCQHLGLNVRRARDGATALRMIFEQVPDLAILDVNMPAADGLSVCEKVVRDTALSPFPVILLTGQSDEAMLRRCEQLGAHYFLKSPDVWDRLRQTVCTLLHLKAEAPAPAPPSVPPLSPSSPKVLLIDDDPDVSKALGLRLRACGVQAFRAFTGMQGYWAALSQKPAVIVSDLGMPDGEGNYLLLRLKMNPLTARIPVIILTGKVDTALERHMRSIGAAAYFTKPADFAALVGELQKHIPLPAAPSPALR